MNWIELHLNKSLHLSDYDAFFPADLSLIDGMDISNQASPHRLWEYGMALTALRRWRRRQTELAVSYSGMITALDVGGAGSGLAATLKERDLNVMVIDPSVNTTAEQALAHVRPAPLVFSVSTLEHVDDLYTFLDALFDLLLPGGLLFLTMDYHAEHAEHVVDSYHFNWMRKRMFGPDGVKEVMQHLAGLGMTVFGDIDWEWQGPNVYDYDFRSVCMIRED